MSLLRLILVPLALVCVLALSLAVGNVAARPTAGTSVRVPRVTHLRLDAAEAKLRARGLRYVEKGGGYFGIVVRHNWQVCFQSPSAGRHVARRTKVTLFVSRPGQC